MRLLMTAWIISKFICMPVWFAYRNFPLLPVHDILLQAPPLLHGALFWIAIAAMAAMIVLPHKKIAIILLLAEITSCLLDQNRWQPWEYQFILMTLAYGVFNNKQWQLRAWQIILAGTWFYSGLSKLQPGFIHDIYTSLILHTWLQVYPQNIWITRAGYALPLFEMAAAVMLLIPATKRPAMVSLVLMHLFILLLLGPTGLSRNEVVWPWNIAMIFFLLICFAKQRFSFEKAFFTRPAAIMLVLLLWLLPVLSVFGQWDRYLSFSLYTGGVPQLYICSSDKQVLYALSPYMPAVRNPRLPCTFPVSAYTWGMQEMNLPAYPQERAYKQFARRLRTQFPGADIKFYLYTSGFKVKVWEMEE